jgi:hypothetical protein
MGLTFHVYRDSTKAWRWTLYGQRYRVIAEAGESYGTWHECLEDLNLVQSEVGMADVWDVSGHKPALIRVSPLKTGSQLRDDNACPPGAGRE